MTKSGMISPVVPMAADEDRQDVRRFAAVDNDSTSITTPDYFFDYVYLYSGVRKTYKDTYEYMYVTI